MSNGNPGMPASYGGTSSGMQTGGSPIGGPAGQQQASYQTPQQQPGGAGQMPGHMGPSPFGGPMNGTGMAGMGGQGQSAMGSMFGHMGGHPGMPMQPQNPMNGYLRNNAMPSSTQSMGSMQASPGMLSQLMAGNQQPPPGQAAGGQQPGAGGMPSGFNPAMLSILQQYLGGMGGGGPSIGGPQQPGPMGQ